MLIQETERLLIRWFKEEDLVAFEVLVRDPQAMRFSLTGPLKSKEEAQELFVKLLSDYESNGFGLFALEEKATGAVIGFTGIKRWNIEGETRDELGYRILPKYWGKGLAFEAAQAVSAWAFETLRLKHLIALIEPENTRSVRLALRLGMKKVRSSLFFGIPVDIYLLNRKYAYKEYDPIYPLLYAKEIERLRASLPESARAEHVGSTAVPMLGGKGIVDIALSVSEDKIDETEKALLKLGYQFSESGSALKRRFFKAYLKDSLSPYSLYHLHLMPHGYFEWNELIGFRDYLRSRPDKRELYNGIKKESSALSGEVGEKYREAKKPLIDRMKREMVLDNLRFAPATSDLKSVIHQWLTLPHVTEWFYGTGLKNTYLFLDDFLSGDRKCTFYIAFDKDTPFALLLTSRVLKPNDELCRYCEEEGEAITLDMLIGDPGYLGRGLAAPLIDSFLAVCYPSVTEVLIEPEKTNIKAIHVYQNVGFRIIEETIPPHSPHPHWMMRLKRFPLQK